MTTGIFDPARSLDQPLLLAPHAVLCPDGVKHSWGLVLEKGRFKETGELEDLANRYAGAARQDLPGRLIMPGFVDSHQHLAQAFGKALAFG